MLGQLLCWQLPDSPTGWDESEGFQNYFPIKGIQKMDLTGFGLFKFVIIFLFDKYQQIAFYDEILIGFAYQSNQFEIIKLQIFKKVNS